jgi:hypothetical protein
MIALLLASVLHLGIGHHHFPPGGGFGFGYGYGYPGYGVGVPVVPSTGIEYINGIPYELLNGQLVAVSIGGVGVL